MRTFLIFLSQHEWLISRIQKQMMFWLKKQRTGVAKVCTHSYNDKLVHSVLLVEPIYVLPSGYR